MSEPEDPTEEEIAAECAKIRAGWDAAEEKKRKAWSVTPPVTVAVVPVVEVAAE